MRENPDTDGRSGEGNRGIAQKPSRLSPPSDVAFSISAAGLGVLLYQPEIPQNTGNIARTCAATHTPLYLVEPLGFKITDKSLKRAGLDYWPHVRVRLFPDVRVAFEKLTHPRFVYFSTHAEVTYTSFAFLPGDCLVFGPETRGLPKDLLASNPGPVIKIPIDRVRVRSLNLSTSVGIALFEAIRQLHR